MQLNNRIPIHTVSFNCSDPEANEFLLELSQQSGGRFHYFSEIPNDPNAPKSWEVSAFFIVSFVVMPKFINHKILRLKPI